MRTLLAVGVLLPALGGCGSPEVGETPLEEDEHAEEVVSLDSVAAAAVELERVAVLEVRNETLEATGVLGFDLNRVAHVGPRAEGRVVQILKDLGDRVARGEALAVLESPELGEAEAAHVQARAELDLARETYERELALYEQGISSRQEMLEARTAFEAAKAAYEAALARHRTLGALDHVEDSTAVRGLYTVIAPISGTVVERNLVPGQIVGPEDDLFTVADLTNLWVILDIYDRDLARVREGMDVDILTAAFPDRTFSGTLTYLGQVMDSVTRTVKARVEVRNPDRELRPGMFVRAVIHGLEPRGDLAIPEEAAQQMEGRTVVFIPVPGEPLTFEVREVSVGPRLADGRLTVLSGLSAGDTVVARGAFYLKSELLKESFGGDHH